MSGDSGSFAARLLAWFDANRRDLPWRGTDDPWAIWVSEVMLQQTRVEAVREPYRRFMRAFPTPSDFAAVDDDGLLAAWRGLGYYRRARLLRDGARQVVRDHDGAVPETSRELGALSGIGTYTRGAIASIAFGEAVPAVDGNVERVLARHHGIRDNVKRGATQRMLAELVLERMDRSRAGDFNQAIMELGATVCTPRDPKCKACPVAGDCEARRAGLTRAIPVLPERRRPVEVTARVVVVTLTTGVLATRIADGNPNAGQLELPGPGVLVDCPTPGDLEAALEAQRLAIDIGPEIARARHSITNHRILVTAHAGALRGRTPRGAQAVDPNDETAPWTTVSRKLLGKLATC